MLCHTCRTILNDSMLLNKSLKVLLRNVEGSVIGNVNCCRCLYGCATTCWNDCVIVTGMCA